jgi:HD-GYP domain-containing protein (c-di-GMP phosphodiesterase class II)
MGSDGPFRAAALVVLVVGRGLRPGYPDRIGGPDLPLAAMIVSVCDAWDAMTALRVYRDAMPLDKARAIMRAGAGKQWNAACVELLLEETSAQTDPSDANEHEAHSAASLEDLEECCAV